MERSTKVGLMCKFARLFLRHRGAEMRQAILRCAVPAGMFDPTQML